MEQGVIYVVFVARYSLQHLTHVGISLNQNSFLLSDEIWTVFETKFLEVADRHALLIQKKVCDMENCPWMTGNIKKDIRQRDYLLKKARQAPCDEDWIAYKSVRNWTHDSVKKNKQTYNKKLIENYQEDARAFWRTMKIILPEKRNQQRNVVNGLDSLASLSERPHLDRNLRFPSSSPPPF